MNFNRTVFSKIPVLLMMIIIFVSCSIGGQYGKSSSDTKFNKAYISDSDVKDFLPWPPPKPTNWLIYDLKSLVDNKKCRTLGDLDRYIVSKLSSANYSTYGYYKTPGGFAIVLPSQKVTEYGEPIPETNKNEGVTFGNITDMLKMLASKQYGYYRILVFIVTTDRVGAGSENITLEMGKNWVVNSNRGLSDDIINMPINKSHIAYFNFYEFEKAKGENSKFLENGLNNPMKELILSGILLNDTN